MHQVDDGLEEPQEWLRLADTASDDDSVPGSASECRSDLLKRRLIERDENLLG
jgi:hypothetical protein